MLIALEGLLYAISDCNSAGLCNCRIAGPLVPCCNICCRCRHPSHAAAAIVHMHQFLVCELHLLQVGGRWDTVLPEVETSMV